MQSQALSLQQVASLCGVSLKRIRQWIDKKELRVLWTNEDGEMVEPSEMIDFLVKHNIPIPDSIVPFRAKKILFVYSDRSDSRALMKFLITFLQQLKKNEVSFIADHITFGPDAKMKVMVFKPDVIVFDMNGNDGDAIAMAMILKGMEEFCSPKMVAIAGSQTLGCNKALALDCGIDVVGADSVEITPLFRRLLDIS